MVLDAQLISICVSTMVVQVPDSDAPTAGPAGPLTEVDLPCRRSEWHGSF